MRETIRHSVRIEPDKLDDKAFISKVRILGVKEMARRVGLGHSTVSEFIRGQTTLPRHRYDDMLDVLKIGSVD